MKWLVFVLPMLAIACSRGESAESKDLCEKAANRWEGCVKEMMGPEMAKMAADKRDIGACARDDRTVAMYRTCLPKSSCMQMMDCMESEVTR